MSTEEKRIYDHKRYLENKEKIIAHNDNWRINNPEQSRDIRRNFQRKRRTLINTLKNKLCADCKGKFPPECMDFDHVRGEKSFNLAIALTHSMKRILNEVAKCDLVCANCHRIRTTKRKLCH